MLHCISERVAKDISLGTYVFGVCCSNAREEFPSIYKFVLSVVNLYCLFMLLVSVLLKVVCTCWFPFVLQYLMLLKL